MEAARAHLSSVARQSVRSDTRPFDSAAIGHPRVLVKVESAGDESGDQSFEAAPAAANVGGRGSAADIGVRRGGGAQNNEGERKRSRGVVAEAGQVQVVDGYEKVLLEDGGFKKRRVGAKRWQKHCAHGRIRYYCKHKLESLKKFAYRKSYLF